MREKKSDENIEPIEERREVAEVDGENQGRNEIAEKIIPDFYFGDKKSKIAVFGESLSNLRGYEESWEKFINGN